MPNEASWYDQSEDGEQHGPCTPNERSASVREGRLSPESLVWRDGLEEWLPASRVEGLVASNRVSGVTSSDRPLAVVPPADVSFDELDRRSLLAVATGLRVLYWSGLIFGVAFLSLVAAYLGCFVCTVGSLLVAVFLKHLGGSQRIHPGQLSAQWGRRGEMAALRSGVMAGIRNRP